MVATLRCIDVPCEVAFEPTGDYHRPLAYVLGQAGCRLRFVSSLAVARTREALYNTWDKNDPKDAQVILHLLKNGTTQAYVDPLVTGHQDLQEMANTYQQISLRKVRLQHSLMTHYLPLYFPEAERYLHSSRAEWFTALLLFDAVSRGGAALHEDRVRRGRHGSRSAGARSTKRDGSPTSTTRRAEAWACPVSPESEAMRMFRVVLEEYRALCHRRKQLEADIVTRLADQQDFVRLQTVPGIGPILALIILAEARDLRRFGCVRQFLKYCGLDLCTEQSGQYRGTTHLSKRGQRAAALRLLDGGHGGHPHATEQLSPEV